MAEREHSPAFAVLPRRARLVFATIQRAIGDGSSACVTYLSFKLDHGIGRKAIPRALTLLDHLGLIDIELGPRSAKSTGSRTAGAGSTRPRLPPVGTGAWAKPPRVAAQKPPKPIKQLKPPKAVRPSTTRRPVTLARLSFMDEGKIGPS